MRKQQHRGPMREAQANRTRFLSQTIHVWQTPVIWATEGSLVTLPCDYRIIGESASTGSFKWYKYITKFRSEVYENQKNFSGRLYRVNQDQFIHGRSAAITLHPVELSDSGMYSCEVIFQIGQQISGEGNGTLLNVTAALRSYTISNVIRMILGVMVVLAALSVCCSSRDKRERSPHLESEVESSIVSSQPNSPSSEVNVAIGINNIQPNECDKGTSDMRMSLGEP
ncbi:uncharacterized protein [Aquarana catesbeiana]|uniref:uncharacterized protein n=1 Tax=Aquarana catesbeiana TaxID=8400 RepID=UPI003CC988DC